MRLMFFFFFSDEILFDQSVNFNQEKDNKNRFVDRMIWKSHLCIQNLMMQGRCFVYKFSLWPK